MPCTLTRCPDDGDPEPDDSRYYPGALEAEHVPDDLMECDGCKELRLCVVIERPDCNVFLCSDCLTEYIEDAEALVEAAV